jgi:hypothetical protein
MLLQINEGVFKAHSIQEDKEKHADVKEDGKGEKTNKQIKLNEERISIFRLINVCGAKTVSR